MIFNKGDKVKWIDDSRHQLLSPMTLNKTYEIIKLEGDCFWVMNDNNMKDIWDKNCFELIQETDFDCGDKVICINGKHNGLIGKITGIYANNNISVKFESGIWNTDLNPKNYNLIQGIRFKGGSCVVVTRTINKQTRDKMELKNIKAKNLKEAKKQFEIEKANAEICFAKQQMKFATDKINRFDREIKVLNENKKPYLEMLLQF